MGPLPERAFPEGGRAHAILSSSEKRRTTATEMVFYRWLLHAESPDTLWLKNLADDMIFLVV